MHDSGKPSIGGSKLKELVDAYERRLIESALADTDGNQRRAAAWTWWGPRACSRCAISRG